LIPIIASNSASVSSWASPYAQMPALLKQDVDAAEAVDRGAHRRAHGVVVAHVAGERRALRRALRLERSQLLRRAHPVGGIGHRRGHVERGDGVAVRGQRERRGPALAVRGAGDERDRAHVTAAYGCK
jgi:hypothetical protein